MEGFTSLLAPVLWAQAWLRYEAHFFPALPPLPRVESNVGAHPREQPPQQTLA
jgi:hypothetical protein